MQQQQPPPRRRIVPPSAQTPVAPAVGGFPRSNTVSDGSAGFAPGVGHLRPATLGYLDLFTYIECLCVFIRRLRWACRTLIRRLKFSDLLGMLGLSHYSPPPWSYSPPLWYNYHVWGGGGVGGAIGYLTTKLGRDGGYSGKNPKCFCFQLEWINMQSSTVVQQW